MTTLYSATLTLFLVMDPLGNIPVFISLLNHVEEKRRSRIILRESLIAFVILVLFLFAGRPILASLQISTPALSIAGGIILFLIALKMIFPTPEQTWHDRQIGEPFIVPMAIPLLAGPSALAMILLFTAHAPDKRFLWLGAITLASAATTLLLLGANRLRKVLGQKGLIALERLMGMLLTTIAVQMFLTGIKNYFA